MYIQLAIGWYVYTVSYRLLPLKEDLDQHAMFPFVFIPSLVEVLAFESLAEPPIARDHIVGSDHMAIAGCHLERQDHPSEDFVMDGPVLAPVPLHVKPPGIGALH